MIKAVFDTNLLVSAFLSRDNPGGASNELLRFARQGAIQLHLSPEIIAETLAILIASERMQDRYGYAPAMAIDSCDSLRTAATYGHKSAADTGRGAARPGRRQNRRLRGRRGRRLSDQSR
jgi:predicted nucleic acid-binding protein